MIKLRGKTFSQKKNGGKLNLLSCLVTYSRAPGNALQFAYALRQAIRGNIFLNTPSIFYLYTSFHLLFFQLYPFFFLFSGVNAPASLSPVLSLSFWIISLYCSWFNLCFVFNVGFVVDDERSHKCRHHYHCMVHYRLHHKKFLIASVPTLSLP